MAAEPVFHTGDVVIRGPQHDARPCFELCSTSGQAQIRFDTWTGAQAAACAFAKAVHVDVWTGEQGALRLVAGFRTSERAALLPRPMPFESPGVGGGRPAWQA